MRNILSIAVLALVTFISVQCNPTKDLENNAHDIPFVELRNYYVYNTVEVKSEKHLFINREDEFNRYFGAAATMGVNGEPTRIDFNTQFVMAILKPVTNRSTDIEPVSVKQNGNSVIFYYRENKGETTSYEMLPYVAVALSKPASAQDLKFYFRKVK